MVQTINVTDMKLRKVNKLMKQLGKMFKDIELKTKHTEDGVKTFIIWGVRK